MSAALGLQARDRAKKIGKFNFVTTSAYISGSNHVVGEEYV